MSCLEQILPGTYKSQTGSTRAIYRKGSMAPAEEFGAMDALRLWDAAGRYRECFYKQISGNTTLATMTGRFVSLQVDNSGMSPACCL